MKKRITITLDEVQQRELEILMEEDGQTIFNAYFVYLIMQEKKRRGAPLEGKRPVGRPKKEVPEEDTNLYPAPYKGGGAYTHDELEAWYAYRDKTMPPLPKPLTKEELKKYN